MYDVEFHILMSEKPKFVERIFNFLNYGFYNCNKYKIKMILLVQENQQSNLEEQVKKYEKENLEFKVLRFKNDEPSYKKFTYLKNLKPEEVENARWFVGIDEDSITDIDGLINYLDEDFDWKGEYYVSQEPMSNIQNMEKDLAALIGKKHWYFGHNPEQPRFGPYHEWEIACLSQGTMKKILANDESRKVMNMRTKILQGWGDHCLGLICKLVKIYPIGVHYLNASHFTDSYASTLECTLMGGWYVHVHHLYLWDGINHALPAIFNRQNGRFGGRKIFLGEIKEDGTREDKGFFTLENRGTIVGPPNWRPTGVWSNPSQNELNLHYMDKEKPIKFQLNENLNEEECICDQNKFYTITA